jgi:hypothetical protein
MTTCREANDYVLADWGASLKKAQIRRKWIARGMDQDFVAEVAGGRTAGPQCSSSRPSPCTFGIPLMPGIMAHSWPQALQETDHMMFS